MLILANPCFVILKQTHMNFFSYAKIFTLTEMFRLFQVLQSSLSLAKTCPTFSVSHTYTHSWLKNL